MLPPKLLETVVAHFHPRRVILFGSVARGEEGPDSDIDLVGNWTTTSPRS